MTRLMTGPVTATLEEELKQQLRRHGIVIWLDNRGAYSEYADALAARCTAKDFPFPVVVFRGSFLETFLDLAPHADDVDRTPLLIYMPGFTEDDIRRTPLLELYAAGHRYRRSLETLVRETAAGKAAPDKIDTFIQHDLTGLSDADAWLAGESARTRDAFSEDLERLDPEWLADGLLGKDQKLKKKIPDENALNLLADHLYRKTGMDEAFRTFFLGGKVRTFTDLGEAFAAWLMCVEYVDDLTVAPHLDALKPLTSLAGPLHKTCLKLVRYFRQSHPESYEMFAMIAEARLLEEIEAIPPDCLGRIDTFKREEERILAAAVQSFLDGDWRRTLDWAEIRMKAGSFWVEKDPVHNVAWQLIGAGAGLGALIAASGRPLAGTKTLEEALQYYTEQGYKIDQAHRRFEQKRLNPLIHQMPHLAALLQASDKLRALYRQWADQLALDFTAICENEGFIPESRLQQREIYDRTVHPLVQKHKKTAYFLIDAFRYEMAAELADGLQDENEDVNMTVSLTGRYAELPTITAVGMNVLSPAVRAGKLVLAGKTGFTGFKTGEYVVGKPDERVRAMGDRSLNNMRSGRKSTRGLTLADVCDRSVQSLKKSCAGAGLIVVHDREIDDAGEADMGLHIFEIVLRRIRNAWRQLRAAGVEEFIFTGDHGFLLKDRTVREIPYGARRDPARRYVLAAEPRAEDGLTHVSLNALGYEGREGYLLFPRDTAAFQTGKTADTFIHGGNSLQERAVPVLTVSHRAPAHIPRTRYQISASRRPGLFGFNRIRVEVRTARQEQPGIVGDRSITVALRVPDRQDVRPVIAEVKGADFENQACRLKADAGAADILFELTGPRDERVRLEIYHPEGVYRVEPVLCEGYFNVSARGKSRVAPDADAPPPAGDWRDDFEDLSVRQVFVHLAEYGAVTEAELNRMLGSPRRVRRFSLSFEDYARRLPFGVRIETTPTGKRYVKD